MVDGLQANGSLMAMEDLATYTVAEREPIRTEYYGYEVVTVPPPSNGGDWLLEMLNIMEEKDISQYDPSTLEYQYIFNEACRIGLVDSYTYIGDPAFYDLPVEEMISDEFAAERAALIDMDNMQAMESVPLSDLPVTKLEPTAEESQHTTHIAVIDQYGNIVSTTNTLGNGWGCKFMAPGLGFFYNSHIGNLDHENPDSPDYVMPGKRVRSTISPSLVLQDGNPIMAVGSPGSLAIPPAVATIINNVLLYGMNVQQAINEHRAMAINRSGIDSPARVSSPVWTHTWSGQEEEATRAPSGESSTVSWMPFAPSRGTVSSPVREERSRSSTTWPSTSTRAKVPRGERERAA